MYVYYLFQIAFVCMYKPTLAWLEHQNGSRLCRLCKACTRHPHMYKPGSNTRMVLDHAGCVKLFVQRSVCTAQ